MEVVRDEVRVRGKERAVDAVRLGDKVLVVTGSVVRTAVVKDEWSVDVDDPVSMIQALKRARLRADLFTFGQRLPRTTPKYPYPITWDNVAAIPITTFEHWWGSQISQEARNKVRKAAKKGVRVRLAPFNEELMRGIYQICNETPIRQGMPYWHYGKDLGALTRVHETYLDRADFVCAYHQDELIGFVKLVNAGPFVRTFHVISEIKHRDKAPTNALIAEAVRLCCDRKVPYLVYGQYDYGKVGSKGLTNFKHENGFQKILLPRYHVPLTVKGKLVITLGLHRGLVQVLPEGTVRFFLELRNRWYLRRAERVQRASNH